MERDIDTPTRPPNILWISTHDINPHLGCYAGVWPEAERAVTPNLDALAARGVRFDNAFATSPVCAPSRSAIMTGCFPTAIGTMHMRTKAVPPPEVRLLPEYLREAGYYCTNNFFTDFQVATPATTFDDCSPSAHWRNRPDPEMPFFASFHGMLTHESKIHVEGEDFEALVAAVPVEHRQNPDEVTVPPYYPDTPAMRANWARYLDLIAAMDLWVGDILDQLEEDGLTESTIVVFWSDHGVGLPRAKRFAYEAGLREPLIVSRPGSLDAGTNRDDLVYLMDLGPTMLAACGIEIPEHMHGRALFGDDGRAPDIERDYVVGHRDRMNEAQDRSRTVRDRRFRYIRHDYPDRPLLQHSHYADQFSSWKEFRRLAAAEDQQRGQGLVPDLLTPVQRRVVAPGKPAEELFDISVDPHETTDLSGDPAYLDDLVRLRGALDDWRTSFPDLGLVDEEELIESWRPGGRMRVTAAPTVTVADGILEATCDTEGASIGWTTDVPGELVEQSFLGAATGDPERDGRHWNLYSTSVMVPVGTTVYVRAWRLGFQASDEVTVDADVLHS